MQPGVLPTYSIKRQRATYVAVRLLLKDQEYLTQGLIDRLVGHLVQQRLVPNNAARQEVQTLLTFWRGLPLHEDLRDLVYRTLCNWLPAIACGYKWGAPHSDAECAVPLLTTFRNPQFSLERGLWHITGTVEEGFDRGFHYAQYISQRLAGRLLCAAVGVRAAYALDRPRPYDLHGLLVPVRVNRKHRTICEVFDVEGIRVKNRKLAKARMLPCTLKHVQGVCRLCELSDSQCPLARATTAAEKGPCSACGRTNLLAGKGICIPCVEQMVKTGVPPAVATRQKHPTAPAPKK